MKKTISINENFSLNVIINDEHVLLISLSYLLKKVNAYTIKNINIYRSKIKKSPSYTEGTDFVNHKKGEPVYDENIKPGSIYLTRLGLIKFCSLINTNISIDIANWAMRVTANDIEEKGIKDISKLFSSILMDVCHVEDENIRNSLTLKLKKLESKLY